MVVTEHDRHRLHRALAGAIGEEEASLLMEHLPPTGWGDVARRADVEQSATLLRSEIAVLRSDLDKSVALLRGEMSTDFAALTTALTDKMVTQTRTVVISMATMVVAVIASMTSVVVTH